jgi:DNA repair protein RecO (recombination protein O)
VPSYPARAIVLRKTRLGEADTIITLLADDGRQIRAVAKGVRKTTSKFGGRLEPATEVDLLLHTGRTLDVISEVRTVDSHTPVREDFDRQSATSVVLDVLDKMSCEDEADPRLFGLAHATIGAVESANRERIPTLVIAFLVKAMAMHGYRPELDACVMCAEGVGESGLFSFSAGGVVCESCGSGASAVERFDPAARAWVDLLLRSTMAEVASLNVPAPAVAECFALVRSFVAYHLPARLKALDFYAGFSVT